MEIFNFDHWKFGKSFQNEKKYVIMFDGKNSSVPGLLGEPVTVWLVVSQALVVHSDSRLKLMAEIHF